MVPDINLLNDDEYLEDLNCKINLNICEKQRYGWLWLSGLTTGFIYEFHPQTQFYNNYTNTIQEGPLGYFTIGDIVSGTTYLRRRGEVPNYNCLTQPCKFIFNVFDINPRWSGYTKLGNKFKVISYDTIESKYNYHDF